MWKMKRGGAPAPTALVEQTSKRLKHTANRQARVNPLSVTDAEGASALTKEVASQESPLVQTTVANLFHVNVADETPARVSIQRSHGSAVPVSDEVDLNAPGVNEDPTVKALFDEADLL